MRSEFGWKISNLPRAVTVIRAAVATSPEAFNAEDLELMDHVYACILNTSHYDESVMEVDIFVF